MRTVGRYRNNCSYTIKSAYILLLILLPNFSSYQTDPEFCMAESDNNIQALDLAGHHPSAPTDSSSLIVRFYRDGAKDSLRRTHAEMLQYGDVDMERCHDHMQVIGHAHDLNHAHKPRSFKWRLLI